MKKSYLNHVITMTLSSAVLSAAMLSPGVMAGAYESSSSNNSLQSDLNTSSTEAPLTDTIQINPDLVSVATETSADQEETTSSFTSEMGVGIGVGAATGGLVAGPVGLIVGGIVGAFIGSNHEITEEDESSLAMTEPFQEDKAHADSTFSDDSFATFTEPEQDTPLQLAQLGPVTSVIESPVIKTQDTLVDVLTSDLSFDVYFRSGSTEIEDFYPARLTALSQLLDEIDELEVHLDGYADRRGDKDNNIALSNARINSVRQALIDSGVDENRIISKAYGEMKMVSAPGDLEAYSFDRKVVIRFERASSDSLMSMHKVLSDEMDDTSDSDPLAANHSTRF